MFVNPVPAISRLFPCEIAPLQVHVSCPVQVRHPTSPNKIKPHEQPVLGLNTQEVSDLYLYFLVLPSFAAEAQGGSKNGSASAMRAQCRVPVCTTKAA